MIRQPPHSAAALEASLEDSRQRYSVFSLSSEAHTQPAYYTVQDLRGHVNGWNFAVRGYAIDGTLLQHTVHLRYDSAQTEVLAWRTRGAKEIAFSVAELRDARTRF